MKLSPIGGSKQQRDLQTRSTTEAEQRGDHRAAAPAWAPRMDLDGASLLSDASIRDFQQGTARYVANAVEQSLLLPKTWLTLGL